MRPFHFAFLAVCVLPMLGCGGVGLTATPQSSAASGARKVIEAQVSGDIETIADYSHPKFIESFGGRDAFIKQTNKAWVKMAQGSSVEVKNIGETTVVSHGGAYYSATPYTLLHGNNVMLITVTSGAVGYSADGSSWVYVDSTDRNTLNLLLPDLPDSLPIPESKQETKTNSN